MKMYAVARLRSGRRTDLALIEWPPTLGNVHVTVLHGPSEDLDALRAALLLRVGAPA